jgi:predicted RecA/RadA family phage recombinase
MATTAQNNIVFEGRSLGFAVDGTGSNDINQGDQVYMDTSAHLVKSLGANDDTNAANFVGVAMESSFINPYGTKEYSAQIPVMLAGVATFNTTSGDTYNEGDAVYVGADAQTVTNTVGGLTKKIGFVKMRPGQSAVAGGTNVTIDVAIERQFPVAGI